ncbi:hypothetical protein [Burkholderia sp. AU6039]|uniref:hypothetical protein n=1 Tax=Burkholderia sp. AU6039 TaxID=2015344 RepID=UPI0015C60943|nr:hypothetical protein [Burkholderia sp. AU6039]
MSDLLSFCLMNNGAGRLSRVDIFRAWGYCVAINHRDNRTDIGIFTEAVDSRIF